MKSAKVAAPKPKNGLGLRNIIGLIFLLIGALLIISVININLPINLGNFSIFLQFGAAIGSILYGLSMFFKKKGSIPNIEKK